MILSAALLPAPALAAPGDTCATAIDVAALPFMASATTCGAGNEFANAGPICADLPASYGGEDVFYKLALGPGNRLGFDLVLPPGATGDLALFLVRQPGCGDPPVCAATSVDLIGAGAGPERIKPQSYPAGNYLLVVDSALAAPDPAQCGAYNLSVTGHLSEFCGNGIVETGELCDDGNNLDGDCCSADCKSQAPAGTTCRAAAGACDLAETCDAAGRCPADQFFSNGTVCRPLAGNCDLVETCTGLGPACPADKVVARGPLCRAPAAGCDQPEFCDGASGVCPADQMLPAGTICALPTTCTQAARCAGAAACPAPMPTSCDDNDLCTMDTCDPVNGCLHRPICARDAGADATPDSAPDGPPDTAPDLAADATPADAPPAPDVPVVTADAGKADAAPSDGPTPGLVPDAAPPPGDARAGDEPMPTGMQSLTDGGALVAQDGGAGLVSPEAGTGTAPDAARTGDGAAVTADAGATDGPKLLNNLDGGCSCRLNSSSSPGSSALWAALAAALGTRLLRRRRRRV